jgi:hypothetical protein
MTDEPSSDLLGALPRTRPHRRSDKRPARATEPTGEKSSPPAPRSAAAGPKASQRRAKAGPRSTAGSRANGAPRTKAAPRANAGPRARAQRLRQPAQPAGTPPGPRAGKPAPAAGVAILGTAVQAAAEIAEIGLTLSGKALRNAIGRLPRP